MSNKMRTKDEVKTSKDNVIVPKKVAIPKLAVTDDNFKPKRIIILEAIKAGGATRDSLMELAAVDTKNLASQFSYLRLMGMYPIKDDKGIYRIATKDEVEKIKLDRPSASSTADPKKRFAQLTKKLATLKAKIVKQVPQETGSIRDINAKIDALSCTVCQLQLAELKKKHPDIEKTSHINLESAPSKIPNIKA